MSRPDDRRPTGLLFRQPTEDETSPGWTEPTLEESDSPSLSDEPSDESGDRSEAPRSSSKASSGGSALSKRALRDAARQGVLMAGAVAHQLGARDELEQQAGLYLADEDDAEAIGDPLANMANRRGGLGAAGNPDLADAIAALIGLAMYIVKQIGRWSAVKAARREQAAHMAAAGPADGTDAAASQGAGTGPQNL